eukprot:c2658_g1_i1.p1 GENE.c2658_g1_i1~~c2658_g1_i1.p1  ORF type:complete len:188 (+),score=48.03 c2658_g1_i1:35-598(+)
MHTRLARTIQAGLIGIGGFLMARTEASSDAAPPKQVSVVPTQAHPKSVAEIRDLLLSAPLDQDTKLRIVDLGVDLAQDPRVRMAVLERYIEGSHQQIQLQQEDLEDKDHTISMLMVQNDRLMSEIDGLKAQIRGECSSTAAQRSRVEPETTSRSNESSLSDQDILSNWWPVVLAVAALVVLVLLKSR